MLAATATAGVVACSKEPSTTASAETSTGTNTSTGTDGNFPISIKHAYGETVIETRPTRVATVAWSNHEVPLALGIVPVGISKATWGDDDNDGLLPWVKDKLDELGAETPVLFDETDSIPFEEVAATKPDVILAAYSGISEEDYTTLSKIAPTIAFPELAWGTSMNDMIQSNSLALGMAQEGEQLIKELDAQIAAALAANPSISGKKVLFSSHNADDLSSIGYYTLHDPRVSFLVSAGLAAPQVVLDETAKTEAFYADVSAEKPELFDDVDLIITYGPDDPAPLLEAMQANALLSKIPAVAANRVVFLGNGPLAAAANPSPLSIPWGLNDYFAKLAEALG